MSLPNALSARHLSISALLALAATAAQPACVAVGTCSSADLASLQADLRLTNGAVVKPGRNPPSRLFCPVMGLAASQAGGAPAPNTFELQFRDLNTRDTGNVRARLMRKSRVTGAASDVVKLESTPSSTVGTVSARVTEPWDLDRFVYYVLIELAAPVEPVEVHSVCLVSR